MFGVSVEYFWIPVQWIENEISIYFCSKVLKYSWFISVCIMTLSYRLIYLDLLCITNMMIFCFFFSKDTTYFAANSRNISLIKN